LYRRGGDEKPEEEQFQISAQHDRYVSILRLVKEVPGMIREQEADPSRRICKGGLSR
jgi:hypothetical protein